MSDVSKPGMGFEVNIRRKNLRDSSARTENDHPFYVAVLGDFSGRFDQPLDEQDSIARRKFVEIDRDNFNDVLARIGVSFDISFEVESSSKISIDINELDDFEPDALYANLDVFGRLRDIRRRLQDKDTFDDAASEIMGSLVAGNPSEPEVSPRDDLGDTADVSTEHLLDDVLDLTQPPESELDYLKKPDGIERLIRDTIAPYIEPAANPRQPEFLDAVDRAISQSMRKILHHTRFQSVEAAWRSVYFLVSRVETGRDLKIYLLDISKHELEIDLSGDATDSALYKLFCDQAINDTPWSLLVGNYTFTDRIDDILLLAQIGKVARGAGAPFLAGARETLAGCESFATSPDVDDWKHDLKPGVAQAWQMLREDPVADYIGLALPRFLLRLPYGKKSRPVESFDFEELTTAEGIRHDHLLWGNAAFVKAEQLARSFATSKWEMRLGAVSKTGNLPAFYYETEGETELLPCAEINLTEKGGTKISERGLIALWSIKNTDAISSNDFNAVASDGKLLRGRWIQSAEE